MKSLQLNYPLKEDIAHMYVLSASISHFILALKNKGRGAYKGYTAVQGEVEKKEEPKQQGNTSAVLHKRYTMCPC